MKIRTDFVSNSSSSSFILQDVGFFRHFGITADDIRDAIVELLGGKNNLDKRLSNEIKQCDDMLAQENNDDWIRKYYSERKIKLLEDGLGIFDVYDMTDASKRKECYKKYDTHFASWIAPNEGDVEKWNAFEDIVVYKCNFKNVMEVLNGSNKDLKTFEYDKKANKTKVEVFPNGAAFVKHVKRSLGIKTMKEVLHDKKTTLMIHFDDNEIYSLDGMTYDGKDNEVEYQSEEHNKKCRASSWDSSSYSRERFFEILIKHFIKKGKVNLADPELLEYWRVPDDHWWKISKDPKKQNKRYLTDSDTVVAWNEVVDDMLHDNSIMHEG